MNTINTINNIIRIPINIELLTHSCGKIQVTINMFKHDTIKTLLKTIYDKYKTFLSFSCNISGFIKPIESNYILLYDMDSKLTKDDLCKSFDNLICEKISLSFIYTTHEILIRRLVNNTYVLI